MLGGAERPSANHATMATQFDAGPPDSARPTGTVTASGRHNIPYTSRSRCSNVALLLALRGEANNTARLFG
jgi:hypothetical protein